MQLIAQQIPSLLFQSSSNTDAAWNEPRAHRAILSQAARQVQSFTLKSKNIKIIYVTMLQGRTLRLIAPPKTSFISHRSRQSLAN